MTLAGTRAIRRRDQLEALNAAARTDQREHAESLLRGIDALARKFATIEHVPLDVLSRYERILVAAHTSNLLRLASYSEDAFLAPEVER